MHILLNLIQKQNSRWMKGMEKACTIHLREMFQQTINRWLGTTEELSSIP